MNTTDCDVKIYIDQVFHCQNDSTAWSERLPLYMETDAVLKSEHLVSENERTLFVDYEI